MIYGDFSTGIIIGLMLGLLVSAILWAVLFHQVQQLRRAKYGADPLAAAWIDQNRPGGAR